MTRKFNLSIVLTVYFRQSNKAKFINIEKLFSKSYITENKNWSMQTGKYNKEKNYKINWNYIG